MIKIGSLYAGVGGICQGFINAGAKVAWANEIDKNACVTYRSNFEHPIFEEDIYNAIDLLTCVEERSVIGGPSSLSVKMQIEVLKKFIKENKENLSCLK